MVELYLVDNGLNHDIDFRAFGVVGRAYMVHSVVTNKLIELRALALLLGVEHRNRVASEVLHKAHTWDIGCTVAKVYHAREWHGALVLLHESVNILGVEDRLNALVNLKDELSLIGIVYRHSRPVSDTINVV